MNQFLHVWLRVRVWWCELHWPLSRWWWWWLCTAWWSADWRPAAPLGRGEPAQRRTGRLPAYHPAPSVLLRSHNVSAMHEKPKHNCITTWEQKHWDLYGSQLVLPLTVLTWLLLTGVLASAITYWVWGRAIIWISDAYRSKRRKTQCCHYVFCINTG